MAGSTRKPITARWRKIAARRSRRSFPPPKPRRPRRPLRARAWPAGLLKERDRAKGFVLAPDRLRPNALREMLARLSPMQFSLASPSDRAEARICRHFAPSLRRACRGRTWRCAGRRKARGRGWRFGRGLPSCFARARRCWRRSRLRRLATLWAVTAGLALLFVPLIGFRLLAAYGLLASLGDGDQIAPAARARITSCRSTRCSCRSIARRICCRSSSRRCRGSTIRRRNSTSRSFSRRATARRSRRRGACGFPAASSS